MKKESQSPILDTHNKINIEDLEKLIKTTVKAIIDDPSKSSLLPPILIHGAPGLGKSSVIRQIAEDLGIGFADVRLAEIQAVDIRGLPSVNEKDKTMTWNPPDFWPKDPNSKGILFFDEITAAPRDSQVASYEIILDRKIGDVYKVPDGWYIVSAGNRTEDRAVATTMSSALANRFLHVELQDDHEAFTRWGQAHNINPSVIGFINYRPNMLFNMKDENIQMGWPTPRSWEKVSRMLEEFKDAPEQTLRTIIYGLVGNRAGVEFMEFYKINSNFANVLDMMTNEKVEVEIPKELDRKYAMCAAVSYLIWRGKNPDDQKKRIDGMYRIALEMTSDFACMLMMSCMVGIDRNKKSEYCKILMSNPKYKEFVKKHGAALRKRCTLV